MEEARRASGIRGTLVPDCVTAARSLHPSYGRYLNGSRSSPGYAALSAAPPRQLLLSRDVACGGQEMLRFAGSIFGGAGVPGLRLLGIRPNAEDVHSFQRLRIVSRPHHEGRASIPRLGCA